MKIIENALRLPVLSSRDLETLTPLLDNLVQNARVTRVFVPHFPVHPDGFLKRTFVIEIEDREKGFQVYISLRPGECGLILLPPRTLKPATFAPKSGFELSLSKHLPGTRIQGLRQIPGERVMTIAFQGTSDFILAFHLIPGKPVGVLGTGAFEVIQSTDQRTHYKIPEGRELAEADLAKIPLHSEWLTSPEHHARLWRIAEESMLLHLRMERVGKFIARELQQLEQKIRSLSTQLESTRKEEDWARYGMILKSHLYEKPKALNGFFVLQDPQTGELCRLPAHPKMTAEEQLNRYFHQEKRKKKRLLETSDRIGILSKKVESLILQRRSLESAEKLFQIEAVETNLGLGGPRVAKAQGKVERKISGFTGRTHRSREGLLILAGRNLEENLLVTFGIAKGNDLWLHVKGRPGSHTVILLPPKRTASLDTLLDAAHLCILHSGGRGWGKTEVDYTFRKYVKKIKNQTEVTYSGNKTLSIVLEEDRLKRLQAAIE
ncbi:MAG: NFACT family protein [Bdellovibrionales bacterium]|nr:NFACT family protein [Bdellovibrionales bacterium]